MSKTAIIAETSTDEKTRAIVTAARKTFLARGFDAASMDQIALTANVSKRTVYNRFRSKEELFAAAITESCQNLLPVNVDDIAESMAPDEVITSLATQFLEGILTPDALSLRRIAAFEAERTPAIGKAYLEHGPYALGKMCAPLLARLAEKGAFKIDDPEQAIWDLGALLTEPLYTRALMGDMPENIQDAVKVQVRRAVAAFKKIYAPA